MNNALFQGGIGLTFDDVLIIPGYSEVLPSETQIGINLTETLKLNIPVLSAAMDTVTEARLAIALAREGGMGIIHRNLSPQDQAREVETVKKSESGMITDPITLPPHAPVREAETLMARFHISGIPVVDPSSGALVGILTNRDLRFVEESDYSLPISNFMTSQGLVTAPEGTSLDEAREIFRRKKIEKLPLVDHLGRLAGLITVKDLQKIKDHPNSAKDSRGRLLVAGAIGVGTDVETRVELMLAQGVDAVAIDTAHGHSQGVVRTIRKIKTAWPELPILAGNVVTPEGVKCLAEAGADVVKVGVGAGSICTTRVVSGAGMPQLSAVYECARAASAHHCTLIADGGIKYSGDVVKALAAGAHAVMLGSMLAGLAEAPGELILYEGRQFKQYRGMGSLGAMQGYGKDRYATGQGAAGGKLVPEGVEGMVAYKGELSAFIQQLVGGIKSGLGYAGAKDLADLRSKARFTRITSAGLIESHPHSIVITREAPNYQRGDSNS